MINDLKKYLIGCLIVIISFVLLMVIGNLIIIGDKLGEMTHPCCELIFYIVIAIFVFLFIIKPIYDIFRVPEIPPLNIDGKESEMRRYAMALVKNCNYIKDKSEKVRYKKELNEIIKKANDKDLKYFVEEEIKKRVDGIDKIIFKYAGIVFIGTSVSQNSQFDSFAVISSNTKMVYEMIIATGFRPGIKQVFRIYINVIVTSLITFGTSHLFNGSGITKFLDFLKNNPIAGILAGSLVDGTIHSLMTLRIGYITKSCLVVGTEQVSKDRGAYNSEAAYAAAKDMPRIFLEYSKGLGGGIANKLVSLYNSFIGGKSHV